jgi:hypothetical protein
MPYVTPLRDIPALPTPQGAFTDAAGRPTREFYSFLAALRAWQQAVQAALQQLEP